MAIRTFTDRDGEDWIVWQVHPAGTAVGFAEKYRDGWVCFERVGGGGRCRIPLDQLPPVWDSLPDHRLGIIRRLAEQTSGNTAAARLPEDSRKTAEDEARGFKSGPNAIISRDPVRD